MFELRAEFTDDQPPMSYIEDDPRDVEGMVNTCLESALSEHIRCVVITDLECHSKTRVYVH